MNKKKLLALLVSSAFLFAACGDDDSPSSPKNEKEISSSSEDDCDSDECDEEKSSSSKKSDSKSSSSKANDKKSSDSKDSKSSDSKDATSSSAKSSDKSSSSVAKEDKSSTSVAKAESSSSVAEAKSSSSFVAPDGEHVATIEELKKNMELDLFGDKVFLSTGSKQGFFALRIPDELWVVTYVDFENGEVVFKEGAVGMEYANTDAAKRVKEKTKEGITISFKVDKEGVLKYAVNGSAYSDVVEAKVSLQSGKVSKAETIMNKVYTCKNGDTTRTFTFFDNSYIVENIVNEKTDSWIGGHYDIQRSTLLMRPSYYDKPIYTMYSYVVGEDNTIAPSNGKSMSCTVKDNAVTYAKKSDLVNEWQSTDNGVEWMLTIKSSGEFEVEAYENRKNIEVKTGFWEIYGNQLMMRNKSCLNPDKCSYSVRGAVSVTSDGMEYKHSNSDTPKMPQKWTLPEYE